MDIALVRDYYSSKSNNIKSFVIILQVFVNNKLETSTIIQAQDKERFFSYTLTISQCSKCTDGIMYTNTRMKCIDVLVGASVH